MEKLNGLSKYKFEKIAVESLHNSLRLLNDSILLFEHGSYPSSFQLAVLSLEEFSKASWVEHYYYTALTNEGFMPEDIEQQWLKLLFNHPKKQTHFISRDLFNFSPKFVKKIEEKEIEVKKQKATYVGLSRIKGKVDVDSRVSIPIKVTSENDAKQFISLMVGEFRDINEKIALNDMYWDIPDMDLITQAPLFDRVLAWPFESGLKGKRWYKEWKKKL